MLGMFLLTHFTPVTGVVFSKLIQDGRTFDIEKLIRLVLSIRSEVKVIFSLPYITEAL